MFDINHHLLSCLLQLKSSGPDAHNHPLLSSPASSSSSNNNNSRQQQQQQHGATAIFGQQTRTSDLGPGLLVGDRHRGRHPPSTLRTADRGWGPDMSYRVRQLNGHPTLNTRPTLSRLSIIITNLLCNSYFLIGISAPPLTGWPPVSRTSCCAHTQRGVLSLLHNVPWRR